MVTSSKISKEELREYFGAWREVYKDKRLKGYDLNILLLIEDTNFKDFYESQEKFAKRIGFSKKSVNEALKNLVKCGYLVIIDNNQPNSRKPHHYKLSSTLTAPVKDSHLLVTDGLLARGQRVTSENKKVVPDYTPKGYSNDINVTELTFLQKGSETSQEPSLPYETSKAVKAVEIQPINNRLFPLPENLTQEQVDWLQSESNLPEEDYFWSDEIYPIFKAHSISKGDTFKNETAFLNGCLRYALVGQQMKRGRQFGGVISVE